MLSPESLTRKSLKLSMVLGRLTDTQSLLLLQSHLITLLPLLTLLLSVPQPKFCPASGPLHMLPDLPGILFSVSYGSSFRS